MAFTTWTAAYQQALDDYVSGAWKYKSYSIGGRATIYSSESEFRKYMEYCGLRAAQEAGTFSARVYAKQGGRAKEESE